MELLLLLLPCSLIFPLAASAREITNACTSQANVFQHVNGTGMHLPLHHPRSPCSPALLPSDLPFSAVIAHDEARIARLAKTPSSRPTSLRKNTGVPHLGDSQATSVPLAPGASVGVGNYVTQLGLGTPATTYAMVVDTGSSLTWLQCSPCVVSCHRQAGPLYNPRASSTYAAVPCSAPQCGELQAATLNPSACSASGVCIYQATYGDNSFSMGYLSRDTVSFGSGRFPGFYYGCGQDNEGLFGRSAGLIGLARNKLSLLYQLAPSLGVHRVIQPGGVLVHAHGVQLARRLALLRQPRQHVHRREPARRVAVGVRQPADDHRLRHGDHAPAHGAEQGVGRGHGRGAPRAGILNPGHVLQGPGVEAARAGRGHGVRRRRDAEAGAGQRADRRGRAHDVPRVRAHGQHGNHREHAAADVQRRLRRHAVQDRLRGRRLQLKNG